MEVRLVSLNDLKNYKDSELSEEDAEQTQPELNGKYNPDFVCIPYFANSIERACDEVHAAGL